MSLHHSHTHTHTHKATKINMDTDTHLYISCCQSQSSPTTNPIRQLVHLAFLVPVVVVVYLVAVVVVLIVVAVVVVMMIVAGVVQVIFSFLSSPRPGATADRETVCTAGNPEVSYSGSVCTSVFVCAAT